MSRATEDQLDALHGLLADAMLEQLRRYREAGEVPAAFLAQVLKLLKDNGVDAPAHKGGKLDHLLKELPDFDEDIPRGGIRLC